jgi:exonuclease SbcC
MADVIQSFQGGVSIDTMFIDEGFGSLDEESLNKAIDTLIDLQQSGRMIGVISHVQELKNAIPAILEVKKTREGYSRTEFVIK